MLLTTFIAIVLGLWSSFHLLHNFSYVSLVNFQHVWLFFSK